jgi:hypothetical protein
MSKLLPVTKEVSDYTDEELAKFYEQFAPVLQKWHHLNRRSIVFMALIFVNLLIILVVSLAMTKGNILEWIPAIIPLGTLCISSGLILFFLVCSIFVWNPIYRLAKCPACHNSLFSIKLEHYCPECGSNQLKVGNWLKSPRCNECGKYLEWRRGGRNYKIRYCTHCGVLLDKKGF